MQQLFRIEGMHCGACVNRVTRALQPLARSVDVTLDPPQACLDTAAEVTLDAVQQALAKAGAFKASAA